MKNPVSTNEPGLLAAFTVALCTCLYVSLELPPSLYMLIWYVFSYFVPLGVYYI